MKRKKIAFFTICSNNYMAYAKVLFASARRYHPDASYFICLVDEKLDQDGLYPPDAALILAHELGIPDFDCFAFQYDIMELNTAVKPFMFLKLFKDFDQVIYLDPDIEIFRPMESVFDALDDGASFVLTPHLCSPAENDAYPNDIVIMLAGIYNLGFLGCSRTSETERILRWWARRLRFECISKQEAGIFVDQKFMDLVPGFAEHCHILRDVTVNVAYWNLAQRSLTQEGENCFVDGRPLTFFHYSGVEPGNTNLLSKYSRWFRDEAMLPQLRALLRGYFQKLKSFGHGDVPSGTYAYGKFASGTPIHSLVRRMFRERYLPWSGNPFETFEEILHLPFADANRFSESFIITNFMKYILDQFTWLQIHFNPRETHKIEPFVRWYIEHAATQIGLDPRMIERVAERAGRRRFVANAGRLGRDRQSRPDVTVVGYLKMAGGVGEAGRQTVRALTQTGLEVDAHDVALGVVADRDDASCDHLLSPDVSGRVQVYHINADQLPAVMDQIKSRTNEDAYRIVVPFWELAEFPDAWRPAIDLVDEVWAPSRFIQTALVKKVRRPVTYMPMALCFDAPPQFDRRYFSIPDDKFLFFFAFDFLSFQERKNPRGVYRAFREAFPRNGSRSDVGLVIKSLNGGYASGQLAELRDEMAGDPNVTLIDGTFTRPETLGLIGACDCILSLHRSEGLGLLVAEALAMGKPVIATDYSATTEFIRPSTGYSVNYRLISVEDGQYPFAAGQWAEPDIHHAAWLMRKVRDDPATAARKAEQGRQYIVDEHGDQHVAALQRARLQEIGLA